MTVVTEVHNLNILLEVISEFTDNDEPLHRAKALKWAGEKNGSKNGLSKSDKETVWQKVLDYELVEFDERGNILKLSHAGKVMMLEFKNRDITSGK